MSSISILDDLASESEIRRVVLEYCRGADRLDWKRVKKCFHPDARDEHGLVSGGIEEVINFFSQWSKSLYQSAMHMVGNQLVEIKGDKAICESYCISYMRLKSESVSTPEFSRLFGEQDLSAALAGARSGLLDFTIGVRFIDDFERRYKTGPWLIANRVVLHEWDRLDPVSAHSVVEVRSGRRDGGDYVFERLSALHA